MSKKKRELPRPPSQAAMFREGSGDNAPLMADQMAIAAAEGRLEQFIGEALPDSDHARKLASMMLGLSGMMPAENPGGPPGRTYPDNAVSDMTPSDKTDEQPAGQAGAGTASPSAGAALPEGVREAVENADVGGLIDLLRHEHARRSGDTAPAAAAAAPEKGAPLVEKMLIDRVMAIAFEHDLTPDWVIMRALKLYTEEYDKTGRL